MTKNYMLHAIIILGQMSIGQAARYQFEDTEGQTKDNTGGQSTYIQNEPGILATLTPQEANVGTVPQEGLERHHEVTKPMDLGIFKNFLQIKEPDPTDPFGLFRSDTHPSGLNIEAFERRHRNVDREEPRYPQATRRAIEDIAVTVDTYRTYKCQIRQLIQARTILERRWRDLKRDANVAVRKAAPLESAEKGLYDNLVHINKLRMKQRIVKSTIMRVLGLTPQQVAQIPEKTLDTKPSTVVA